MRHVQDKGEADENTMGRLGKRIGNFLGAINENRNGGVFLATAVKTAFSICSQFRARVLSRHM